MKIPRRKILKANLAAASIGLVGYNSGRAKASSSNESADVENNRESPTEIKLEMEPVSLPQSERESINPIVFGERSRPEQEKLETAIETGKSVEQIGNESDAIRGIQGSIEERTSDDPQVFVTRGNSHFAIRFVVGDYIVANPDETPPADPIGE